MELIVEIRLHLLGNSLFREINFLTVFEIAHNRKQQGYNVTWYDAEKMDEKALSYT